jgi:Lon protease-like protein
MNAAAGPLPVPLPLFPLRTVLFPGAQLSLRVFEARYLDLVSQCLRDGQPFGLIALRQGTEAGPGAARVSLEPVGTLAHIEDVDAEQAGLLQVRCRGGLRFRVLGAAERLDDGLWVAPQVESLPADAVRMPGPAMLQTVQALAEAIRKLQEQGTELFFKPYRLDEAGWVANRWCELLPISMGAKQKLMELDDPVIRLSLVDGYLRDKKVVIG